MSPDFTGISSSFREVTYQGTDSILKLAVGGGFVETYAFGGAAPDQEEQTGQCVRIASPSIPFTLSDAIGISSAAFAQGHHFDGPLQDLVPRVSYWPISGDYHSASVHKVGDGCILENSGLLALLQRRVSLVHCLSTCWFFFIFIVNRKLQGRISFRRISSRLGEFPPLEATQHQAHTTTSTRPSMVKHDTT